MTVTVIIVFASLFGLAVFHTVLVQGQARLDGLDARVSSEEALARELRLEVAGLEAPSRIVAEAQGRLGLVSPPEITYLMPSPPVTAPPTEEVDNDQQPDDALSLGVGEDVGGSR